MSVLPKCIKTPSFIDDDKYAQPAPPQGRKGYQMRKMEPDVVLALQRESLLQIHAEPDSVDGRQAILLYNVITFQERFDARLKPIIAGKSRYGNVCRAMHLLCGMMPQDVNRHLLSLLEKKVLFVRKDERLTPYPFFDDVMLVDGTKQRRKETDESASGEERANDSIGDEPASDLALPRRIVLPDYLKDKGFSQPPLPVGKKAWRRSKLMAHSARHAFAEEELRKIHAEFDSEDGKQRLTVLSIVAFGKNFVPLDRIQANQVYYGTLCRAAQLHSIAKVDVDRHLKELLERGIVHVVTDSRGDRTLSASCFLETVQMATAKVSKTSDAQEELLLDPTAKIATPEFVLDARYRSSDAPGNAARWSRADNIGHDVLGSLSDASLRAIHSEYDSTEQGKERIQLFNVIAFGALYMEQQHVPLRQLQGNNITYGQLCRAAIALGIAQASLDKHLKAMLESKAVTTRYYEPDKSVTLRAFPFLSFARLAPQEERLQNYKRLRDESSYRAQLSKLTQEPESKKQERLQTRSKRKREGLVHRRSLMAQDDAVTLGEESHCIGFNGKVCCFGENGQPRTVTPEDWMMHFGIRKTSPSQPAVRKKACDQCHAAHRNRTHVNYFNVQAQHTDLTIQALPLRLEVDRMIANVELCSLCGGQFLGVSDDRINPWKVSVNATLPSQKIFANMAEFRHGTNLVHVACNFAQHYHSFEETVAVVQFIAERTDLRYDGNAGRELRLDAELVQDLKKRGQKHGLTSQQMDQVIARSVQTREPFTGMSIGYGNENDIDLSKGNDLHPLLRFTVDRIDGHVEKDSPDNYRVVLRIFNWIANDFDDQDAVIRQWLRNIVAKFRDGLHLGEKESLRQSSESLEAAQDDNESEDLLPRSKKARYAYQYLCPVEGCGKKFSGKNRFDWHMRTHSDDRPFVCTQPGCNLAFYSKTLLKNHLNSGTHSTLRFVCFQPHCEQIFATQKEREAHLALCFQ